MSFCRFAAVWRETPFVLTRTMLFDASRGDDLIEAVRSAFPEARPVPSERLRNHGVDFSAFLRGTGDPVFPEATIPAVAPSEFARRVMTACARIPFGQVVAYGDLAAAAGVPGAARAVGTVMAQNPLPLVVPCHRVVRSDGRVGEFGPGQSLKIRLLRREGSRVDNNGHLRSA